MPFFQNSPISDLLRFKSDPGVFYVLTLVFSGGSGLPIAFVLRVSQDSRRNYQAPRWRQGFPSYFRTPNIKRRPPRDRTCHFPRDSLFFFTFYRVLSLNREYHV